MKNISQKIRHKNTPTKQLVSIIITRYLTASIKERQAIIEFFNWAVRNAYDRQLQGFYIEVRARVLEVK